MEQGSQQVQNPQVQYAPNPQNQTVSFPTPQKNNGKGNFIKWAIALIGAVVIVLVGGFLVIKGFSTSGNSTPTPSPEGVLGGYDDTTADSEPTSTPTSTPQAMAKSDVKIEILNGTGIPGEASFLKTKLEGIGYTDLSAANADTQNEKTTTVTFDKSVPSDIVDEITSLLNKTYTDVTVKNSSLSNGVLVRVLTGPREGAKTPAPSTTPTATSTPSPTTSPTPSAT